MLRIKENTVIKSLSLMDIVSQLISIWRLLVWNPSKFPKYVLNKRTKTTMSQLYEQTILREKELKTWGIMLLKFGIRMEKN